MKRTLPLSVTRGSPDDEMLLYEQNEDVSDETTVETELIVH